MVRMRSRLLVLAAVAAGVLTCGGRLRSAQEPEPVSEVRVKLSGAAMLAEAQNAGIDLDHGVQRVPDGHRGRRAS